MSEVLEAVWGVCKCKGEILLLSFYFPIGSWSPPMTMLVSLLLVFTCQLNKHI